ncbi:hypothetical protein E0Z10_g7250 [Xylaria hypoxylon]|uniref:Uncharacterized protein n=1 Tax=Xylaria hypoxylon TaxID=37992 RepID=A0A4Z0YQU2_9PEZI|nr:hypothetical protein E0Z10_g7250 [Xylaria hypoxylon]
MTSEQDDILKRWRYTNSKDKGSVKPNYDSLCCSLFGDGVQPPENPEYHYYIPEHITNSVSFNRGQQNIDYFRQRQSAPQPVWTSSSQQQPNPMAYRSQHPGFIQQHATDPLLLDEPPQPENWTLMKPPPDQDSGYDSNGIGKSALQPNTDGYINPQDMYWQHFNQNIASAGAFSQDALERRPPAIDLGMEWEP